MPQQPVRSKSNPTQRQPSRAGSWSLRSSPRSSPSTSPQAPPWSVVTTVVEVPSVPHDDGVLAKAGLGVVPLFTAARTNPEASPVSVLELVNAASASAAGWGAETRTDSEPGRERIDRELEREFEAEEHADRILFASGLRPRPRASGRGVPPNAPFMPSA